MNCHDETSFARGHMGMHHGMGMCCGHGIGSHFLSKKKKIEALKQHLANMRERVEDIEAYIAELQKKN